MKNQNEIQSLRRMPTRRFFPVLCVFFIGMIISLILFVTVKNWEQTKQRIEFESRSRGYANAIESNLKEYLRALQFIGDFLNNSPQMNRQKFSNYVKNPLSRYPGIKAFSWNPLVKAEERANYESLAQKEGFHDFKFTERTKEGRLIEAGQRKEYVVVYYIDPLETNKPALGFDIASNSTRLQAIEYVFNKGTPAVTGRITLVQETGSQFGTLLLLPIYQQGVSLDTLEKRRQYRKGVAVEVLRIGDVVETALSNFPNEGIDVYLYDISAMDENSFLYFRPSKDSVTMQAPMKRNTIEQGLHWSKSFKFANRQWKILFHPSKFYLDSHKAWQAWTILIGSLLLTTILIFYLYRKIKNTIEIEWRVDQQIQTNQQLEKLILDLQRTEEELKTKTNRLESAMISLNGGVWDWNIVTSEVYFSPEWIKMLGYGPEEIKGHLQTWESTLHPEDKPKIREILSNYFTGKSKDYRSEHRMRTKSGNWIWVIDTGKIVEWDKSGNPLRMTGTDIDVTNIKQKEEERIQLFTVIEQAYESIVVTDIHGNIEYVNASFEKTSGYTLNEIIGKNPRFLKSGTHDVTFYKQIWDTIKSGNVWSGYITNKKKDGTLYEENTTISPVHNKEGKIINFVAIKYDVTHEKNLESQLRQAQKMEAIGTLAGGIAHDFNNILQGIFSSIQIVKMKLPSASLEKKYLEQAFEFSRRGADLVRQILTFSRQTDTKHGIIQMVPIVKEVLKMMKSTLPTTITIQDRLPNSCVNISGNLVQIHQVIMNICTNAGYAMRETGGVLTVKLEETTLSNQKAANLFLKEGKYLKLTISDTGTGIPPDVQEHIFEPFFTTKSKEEGTGLGLSVVHGIVRDHKGAIFVESVVNNQNNTSTSAEWHSGGTKFDVFFPVVEAKIQSLDETQSPALVGTEQILLVDDEEIVVETEKLLLEGLGYKVKTAYDGKQALDIFLHSPNSFDIVITDQTMPKMTGDQLAQELLKIRPNIPIILMTGFSHKINLENTQKIGIHKIVMKPIEGDQLGTIVREVFDKSFPTIYQL